MAAFLGAPVFLGAPAFLGAAVFLGMAVLGLAGCAASTHAGGPENVLKEYARSLQSGNSVQAYALLSDDAKRSIPFQAFQRMVQENPGEVQEIGRALLRPAGPAHVTASVTLPDGQSLLLILEGGQWRIDGAAIDLYSQATPESALRAFVRAFQNRRWDVLLRFVPEKEAEGLQTSHLKAAWEGEQKQEMERLTQALAAALPTAKFERVGERATLAYGAGGTVELVREQGRWKVEDFK